MRPKSVVLETPPLSDGMEKYYAGSASAKGRQGQDASKREKPPRKRARVVEDGSAADKVDEKRARGRPRLNTQDETAADRRRTQIRLAQRAYRNRKDHAISTLEQKVKDLEDVNEGMSKALSTFYDIAIAQGMLNSAPEAVRRLKDLSEAFLRVENKSGQDDEQSSQTNSDPAANAIFDEVDAQPSTSSSSTVERSPKALEPSNSSAHVADEAAPGMALPDFSESALAFNPLQFEVITQPTPDNASYPFYIDLQSQLQFTSNFDFQTPLLTQSLPLPASYSAHERSFGRRLHRKTVEAGLRLATMPNPPHDQFAAVFGFCLLYESRDVILDRLARSAGRKQDEGLSNWTSPFTNLGGAGAYALSNAEAGQGLDPLSRSGALPPGSHPDREFRRTPHSTGYSMGPFDTRTQAVADEWLSNRNHMKLAGFEGTFFDSADVDYYFTNRNIFIPPYADFVEAEIDINDFPDPPEGCDATEFLKPDRLKKNSTVSWGSQNPENTGDFGADSTDSGSGPGFAYCALFARSDWPQITPSRFKVTIDVSVLIDEMIGKAVCLSRTPGFRPKHVNRALKAAIGLVERTTPGDRT